MGTSGESPLVSVICTARDAEKTLAQAIKSVFEQEFTDWELIFVDDRSRDKTADIAGAASAADSRMKIHATVNDGGRGQALNLALREARGRYICNIDADDLWHPSYLEIMVSIVKNCSERKLLAARSFIFGQDSEVNWQTVGKGPVLHFVTLNARLCYGNPICHSAVIYMREDAVLAGGYNEQIRSQFDYDLWIRLASLGIAIERVELNLVAKRIHAGQKFAGRKRFSYCLNSALTQGAAIRQLNGRWYCWVQLAYRLVRNLLAPAAIKVFLFKAR